MATTIASLESISFGRAMALHAFMHMHNYQNCAWYRSAMALESSSKENQDSNPFQEKDCRSRYWNTKECSKWALSNFTEWFNSYNRRNKINPSLPKFFPTNAQKKYLNKWLSIFVSDTQSKDGDLYLLKTIQSPGIVQSPLPGIVQSLLAGIVHSLAGIVQYLAGIVHSMKLENPNYTNFLSKEDPVFFCM